MMEGGDPVVDKAYGDALVAAIEEYGLVPTGKNGKMKKLKTTTIEPLIIPPCANLKPLNIRPLLVEEGDDDADAFAKFSEDYQALIPEFDRLPPAYSCYQQFHNDVYNMPSVWAYLVKVALLSFSHFVLVMTDAIERHDEKAAQPHQPIIRAAIKEDDADKLLTVMMRLAATHPSMIFERSYNSNHITLIATPFTCLWMAAHHHLSNAIKPRQVWANAAHKITSAVLKVGAKKRRAKLSQAFAEQPADVKKYTADLTDQFRKEPAEFGKCMFAVMLAAAVFKKPFLDFAMPWTEEQLKEWNWTQDFPPLPNLTTWEHHLLGRHWAMHDRINPFSSLNTNRDGSDPHAALRDVMARGQGVKDNITRVHLLNGNLGDFFVAPPNPTGASALVGSLGNIRVFKQKLLMGRELFLMMRFMNPEWTKQSVYDYLRTEFQFHPKTAKPMTASEIKEHRKVVIKRFDESMRRRFYKDLAEFKQKAEAKARIEAKKAALEAKKQAIEAELTATSSRGRKLTQRQMPGRDCRKRKELEELETAEQKALQEEVQIVADLEAFAKGAVASFDRPLRSKGSRRKIAKKQATTLQLEPPKRDTTQPEGTIVYLQPGEDWMLVTYYKVNLLCSLVPHIKNACKNGKIQGVDIDAIDKEFEDNKQKAFMETYTTNLLAELKGTTGKNKKTAPKLQFTKKQMESLQTKAAVGIDYSGAIVNAACKKIAISLDFVDKMEFKKSATDNVQFNAATPKHIYTSLRTWLSAKEIENFALACTYIGALFVKKQETQLEKIVSSLFKASEKSQLDLMVSVIWVTLNFTNRADRQGTTSTKTSSSSTSRRGTTSTSRRGTSTSGSGRGGK